jgi:hypothetical protein
VLWSNSTVLREGRQSIKLWTLTLLGLMFGVTAVGCGSSSRGTGGDGAAGGSGDDTPAAITIVTGNDQEAEAGTEVPIDPVARVTNAAGEPLEGANVSFAIVAGGGSVAELRTVTNRDGEATAGSWTLGPEPGVNALAAITNGLSTTFSAVGTAPGPRPGQPAAIDIREGNDQTGRLEEDLPIDPRVVVIDEDGDPLAGANVTFTPLGGSGTVGTAAVVTDENGEASTTWALGQTGTNLMEATAGELAATFFAIGSDSDYEIEIVFLNPATTISQKNAFGSAAGRWMEVVTGDLTDVTFPSGIGARACGLDDPSNELRSVVDDLLIYASLVPIDGPGGVLGAAGPCVLRSEVPDAPLTVVGVTQFDIFDLDFLESIGLLDDVILHEIAHVLGFGSLWSEEPFDFLQNPSFPNNPGADTHFNGPNAVAAFDDLPGGPWIPPTSATSKVPVENTEGGSGVRDSHWRESTFVTELMTGFIGTDSNPMSTVTIESLRDLGYEVDITQADPYSLEGENGQPALQPGFLLLDDVLHMPMHHVDAKGNIVGVTDP